MKVQITTRAGRKILQRGILDLESLEAVAMQQGIDAGELMANRALLREGKTAFLKLAVLTGEHAGQRTKNKLQPILNQVY